MTDRAASRSILLAEDDECLAALLHDVLASAGFDVSVVHDGLAALDVASPGLAILDVNLPGISGYQVCHLLRRVHGARLPIIFVSGERTESFDRVAGLLLGGDDYLVKPFAPDELLARVGVLVGKTGPAAASTRRLTARELEVLALLAEGLGQAAIAERLVISGKTVSTHIEHILGKLGVKSRAQAVAVAYRESLVP